MGIKMKNFKKVVKKRDKKVKDLLFEFMDYKLRPIQEEAIEWSIKNIEDGKKFLALELPTGSGKSIYSQYFCKKYLERINGDAKFDILTNSKILQTQYVDEFTYIENLWGKANYECDTWNGSCEFGSVCNQTSKKKCQDCPYDDAKNKWLDGKISLTNFHLIGLYSLFNSEILDTLRKSDVLIIDEAHSFEEVINNFVSFVLGPKTWRGLIVNGRDSKYEFELAKFETIDEISRWIENVLINDLVFSEGYHRSMLPSLKGKKVEEKVKAIKNITELKSKLKKFLEDYSNNTSEWVSDKKIIKGDVTWTIQPLWTGDILFKHIWHRYKHIILMSGTIIDGKTFSFLNGIPEKDFAFFSQPSPFDVSKRPIYYYPQGKLSYQHKESSWEKFVPVINKILKKYQGKKGIIHTNSYEFLEFVKKDIKDDRLIFVDPDKRDAKLVEHINREDDCVLVSASMAEGIDLKDDLSRFQIIIKVPYPSLNSKVNQIRLKNNSSWYSLKTIQTLIQSYGRSVRNETDWCDTFILDSCFGDILASNSKMFPKYFLDALKRIKTS
jgi:Rad3-related DNA helicase